MNDNLNELSDQQLNELFAVEVAGMRVIADGIFWSDETKRAKIINDGALHLTRKNLGIPDGNILLSYCADANAVLPWLEKAVLVDAIRSLGGWHIGINPSRDGCSAGEAPTFARAAVIALIRSNRQNNTKK